MEGWPWILVAAVGAGSLAATRAVLPLLRRWQVVDHPNLRSSHERPTPRGGGLGLLAALIPGLAVVALALAPDESWARLGVLALAVVLAALSWADDRRGLSARLRLAAHALVAAGAVLLLPDDRLVAQGLLPWWLDRVVAFMALLWFVNLFNFMDGIDGITGIETVVIGAGLWLVVWLVPGLAPATGWSGAAAAAAALGFLWWNWHPARLFMGDVGSVPLGFLLGWWLLDLAGQGAWAAALILPAYYLADATLTLLRRLLRGAKVWEAHREHAYQRAVQRGLGHAAVSLRILAFDLVLLALALAAALRPQAWALTLACAAATVLALLLILHAGRGQAAPGP